MSEKIIRDAERRMDKALQVLDAALKKIRTGRANPALLEDLRVNYYDSEVPIGQVASIAVEEGRTLLVTPWEKQMVAEVERAIQALDLGLNPVTAGSAIRVPMPPLTEETRREFIKQAKAEAEAARVAIRNVRRDANTAVKELLKAKDISQDDERRAGESIQKLTDQKIAEVEKLLEHKEADLLNF